MNLYIFLFGINRDIFFWGDIYLSRYDHHVFNWQLQGPLFAGSVLFLSRSAFASTVDAALTLQGAVNPHALH